MRLLVDIGHPAHVHVFKHIIWNLKEHGHVVKIRDQDRFGAQKI
jgi:predicted glycosyltransferase